jgi:hypothetical protein
VARRRPDRRKLKRERLAERKRAERRRQLTTFGTAALVVVVLALGFALAFTAGDRDDPHGGEELAHVHGLGVNPKDGTLYIAAHSGLYRVPDGTRAATHVGDTEQDVMGFSVLGPDRFLGSGHPGPNQDGPPNLGLIRSDDAGRSWDSLSLLGRADFHVLRSHGATIYGFDGMSGKLMVSRNGGRDWNGHDPPGPMIDLAIDPSNRPHIVASVEQGLVESRDGGRSWRPLVEGRTGLLAWPAVQRLYFIDRKGVLSVSGDAGRDWRQVGSIDARPAAFAAAADDLYAALPDGTVMRSGDAGAKWELRATP